ncbi:MAG: Extracellular ligand-binding receptor [Planctomycetaceae bacterium]|nr:Extracellular ligand-binding receptor [Planctomycetaceae bacterium]
MRLTCFITTLLVFFLFAPGKVAAEPKGIEATAAKNKFQKPGFDKSAFTEEDAEKLAIVLKQWGVSIAEWAKKSIQGLLKKSAIAGSTVEIAIGHYASLTGPLAAFGHATDDSIQLAVEEINAAGGIKGRKIRLITCDDQGDRREVGNVVTRLVKSDKVVAVLGEVASSLSLAGAPICQENGVPMLSPASTHPQVTRQGDMIFRTCCSDAFQGAACARFAAEYPQIKAKSAALLYDKTASYCVRLQESFEKKFVELKGEIVLIQTYEEGTEDFSAQLKAIRESKPDVIFIPGYDHDVANIAVQARKLGIETPLLGGDAWDSPKLGKVGGKALNHCYYLNHYSAQDPNPRNQEFIKKFSAKYKKTPEIMSALGYEAIHILAAAMERAKSMSGKEIAAEIASTKDFEGVTGKITIGTDRSVHKSAVILEWKDGVPTYVTTIPPGISN